MATITLQVGATTSTRTISDANAARIFTAAKKLRGTTTNQATLDAILQQLLDGMINDVQTVEIMDKQDAEREARIARF
jgi:hypothetical protein